MKKLLSVLFLMLLKNPFFTFAQEHGRPEKTGKNLFILKFQTISPFQFLSPLSGLGSEGTFFTFETERIHKQYLSFVAGFGVHVRNKNDAYGGFHKSFGTKIILGYRRYIRNSFPGNSGVQSLSGLYFQPAGKFVYGKLEEQEYGLYYGSNSASLIVLMRLGYQWTISENFNLDFSLAPGYGAGSRKIKTGISDYYKRPGYFSELDYFMGWFDPEYDRGRMGNDAPLPGFKFYHNPVADISFSFGWRF